jgi:hypothetical protein
MSAVGRVADPFEPSWGRKYDREISV